MIVKRPRNRFPRLLDQQDAALVGRGTVLFVVAAALVLGGSIVLGLAIHFVRTLGGV